MPLGKNLQKSMIYQRCRRPACAINRLLRYRPIIPRSINWCAIGRSFRSAAWSVDRINCQMCTTLELWWWWL